MSSSAVTAKPTDNNIVAFAPRPRRKAVRYIGGEVVRIPVSSRASLPADADETVVEIVRHWRTLHDGSQLPDRSQIDPLDFPRLFPGIALIDVERVPFRFRFRLLGERMNRYHGKSYKGRYLDEAFDHFHATATRADLQSVTERHGLSYRRGQPLMMHEKSFVEMERVFLPFRNGGPKAELVLAYTVFR
ncbi:MAG: PAS domain-containing protein [Alphaproteobacteria bacterium]|nr:PAS domain-containing protein [Alphaproteobacteria bacterium]